MKKFILVIVFCVSSLLKSQSQFQSFIDNVNSISNPSAKIAAVDSFMNFARSKGIPFIEDSTANFIYNANVSSVAIAGDFNGWNYNGNQLTKLAGTNFWYKSYIFEMDARLDYKFVINGSNWILDPENPNTCSGGFGPNSELSMLSYIQPWEIQYNQNIAHGYLISKSIFSKNVNTNYQVTIYLPPDYDSLSNKSYPSVYFQDGTEYISLGKAVNVLDNLIAANKIQPIIGVFVKPNNRNEEYAYSKREQYRLFFIDELAPFIDSLYIAQFKIQGKDW